MKRQTWPVCGRAGKRSSCCGTRESDAVRTAGSASKVLNAAKRNHSFCESEVRARQARRHGVPAVINGSFDGGHAGSSPNSRLNAREPDKRPVKTGRATLSRRASWWHRARARKTRRRASFERDFSFGDHCARPPSLENASRISVVRAWVPAPAPHRLKGGGVWLIASKWSMETEVSCALIH